MSYKGFGANMTLTLKIKHTEPVQCLVRSIDNKVGFRCWCFP